MEQRNAETLGRLWKCALAELYGNWVEERWKLVEMAKWLSWKQIFWLLSILIKLLSHLTDPPQEDQKFPNKSLVGQAQTSSTTSSQSTKKKCGKKKVCYCENNSRVSSTGFLLLAGSEKLMMPLSALSKSRTNQNESENSTKQVNK